MASRAQDQGLVAQFADAHGLTSSMLSKLLKRDTATGVQCQIVPSFGWHPWFSHQIYDDSVSQSTERAEDVHKLDHYQAVLVPSPHDSDFLRKLPDPRPLSELIDQTRLYLEKYPFALVGEIGIDRSFRIPENSSDSNRDETESALTPGGREGKRLTPYRVHMDHQKKILTAQLQLAGELSRPVSVHGVAAHGALFETLQATWRGHEKVVVSKRIRKRTAHTYSHPDEEENRSRDEVLDARVAKPFPPRICLHSYSGPPGPVKQYLHPSVPATIFFSFSKLVNFSSSVSSKAIDVIKEIPDDRLLAESDLHCAGERMDDLLERVVRTICQIKRWPLEKGIRQLASNWVHFIIGESSVEKSD
ncbi:hypothetical protein MMC07_004168 [Pseudocyphellaria aurata]|nr:hypothetical protein [Pseudocyphellaria aurata]